MEIVLYVLAGLILGMIAGTLLGGVVASLMNLWSKDLAERGLRRKVCGFAGTCLGGFLGAVAGVLARVL
tara:strand:+ start:40 stop:246 length:207 start_codon:yes stop_codon:yes gene_type:complete